MELQAEWVRILDTIQKCLPTGLGGQPMSKELDMPGLMETLSQPSSWKAATWYGPLWQITPAVVGLSGEIPNEDLEVGDSDTDASDENEEEGG